MSCFDSEGRLVHTVGLEEPRRRGSGDGFKHPWEFASSRPGFWNAGQLTLGDHPHAPSEANNSWQWLDQEQRDECGVGCRSFPIVIWRHDHIKHNRSWDPPEDWTVEIDSPLAYYNGTTGAALNIEVVKPADAFARFMLLWKWFKSAGPELGGAWGVSNTVAKPSLAEAFPPGALDAWNREFVELALDAEIPWYITHSVKHTPPPAFLGDDLVHRVGLYYWRGTP